MAAVIGGSMPIRRVAVVVVTFDRHETLGRAVAAHLNEMSADDVLVIVDNGPEPIDRSRVGTDPRIELIDARDNLGPAGGFALGMQRALDHGVDALYLINDDDLPVVGAMSKLVSILERRPLLSMCAGLVRRCDGSSTGYGSLDRDGLRPAPRPPDGGHAEVDVLPFVGLLIRSHVVDRVGVPTADFFMMGEEVDFCLRCRAAGVEIRLYGFDAVTAQALAASGGGGAHYEPWRGYYQARNAIRISLERGGVRRLVRALFLQAKLLVGAFTIDDRRATRVRLRAQGLWHGLRGVRGRTLEPS